MNNLEQRVTDIGNMADDMAAVMQVTPNFIAEWGPTTHVYTSEPGSSMVPFSKEDGVKDGLNNSVKPHIEPLVDQLVAYDDALCWSGLYRLTTPQLRKVLHLEGPESWIQGPYEPKRAGLTGTLLGSIKAAQQIGNLTVEHLEPKSIRKIEKRAARLAKTIVTIAFDHPQKIFLATEKLTSEQLNGMDTLTDRLGWGAARKFRNRIDIIRANGAEQAIDESEWQEQLRHIHLGWLSKNEFEEEQQGLQDLFDSTRQRLQAEREDSPPRSPDHS